MYEVCVHYMSQYYNICILDNWSSGIDLAVALVANTLRFGHVVMRQWYGLTRTGCTNRIATVTTVMLSREALKLLKNSVAELTLPFVNEIFENSSAQ